MYIDKYWDNYIGGSDDSLNLVAFLEDLKKEEIPPQRDFCQNRTGQAELGLPSDRGVSGIHPFGRCGDGLPLRY